MDEIRDLRELRAELPPIRPEARHAALASLNLRFADAATTGRPVRRRRRNDRGLRLALAATALVTVVSVVSVVDLGGKADVEPASAAQALQEVSGVAADRRPEPPPGPGQFFYIRSREAYIASVALPAGPCHSPGGCEAAGEASVLEPSMRETWIGPNGNGRFRTVSLEAEFLSPAERRHWFGAGLPQPREAGLTESQTYEGAPILDTSKLPAQPAALRRMIERREIESVDGPKGEAETFVLIGDMLRDTYLPPGFRAELYAVAAELPKVELLGEVRDPVGRPGIAVAYSDNFTRHELIFDPETSALLGEREVSVRPGVFDAPAGTEVGSAAYLESGVVEGSDERPSGEPEAAASGRRPSPAG